MDKNRLLEKYLFLSEMINDAVKRGELRPEEAAEINSAGVNVLVIQGGVEKFDSTDPAHLALLRHAVAVRRRKWEELRPDMALTLAALDLVFRDDGPSP